MCFNFSEVSSSVKLTILLT